MSKHVPATISDVAKAAGVGRATAARTLGGYGYVSAATRDRVLEAVEALDYRPNAIARSMSTGSTQTIGVVIGDIGNVFFADLVRGITDAAKEEGFDTIIINTDEKLEAERDAVNVLLDKRVDGVIITSAAVAASEAPHLLEFRKVGIPIVLADRLVSGFDVDAVIIDNRGAAREAVNVLIGAGHRRIAMIWGPKKDVPSETEEDMNTESRQGLWTIDERFQGYRDALRAADIPVDPKLIATGKRSEHDAAAQLIRMLSLQDPPTAVLTTETEPTIGVLRAIRSTDRKCPQDLSVIGFDDSPWAAVMSPPLSMMEQPTEQLGRAAARLLLKRIHGSVAEASVSIFDARLVERRSVATPSVGSAD